MSFEVSRTQREEERTRIGALAVERGLLSQRELQALLERTTRAPRGRGARLGELLVRERYLTTSVLRELLDEQRRRRHRRAAPPAAASQATTAAVAQYLARLKATGGQELLLMTGRPPAMRIPDALNTLDEPAIGAAQLDAFAAELFDADQRALAARGVPAIKLATYPSGRFRVTLTPSAQGQSISFRPIGVDPRGDGIELPHEVVHLADLKRGLVVIAGGSSVYRASLVAKLVDVINATSKRHVITIDRRPTYEHHSKLSLIAEREVGVHTDTYETALRASLREDPDVLAIGEIHGADAIATALLSAETGHLVICSLHATTPAQALRRLIDVQGTNQRALVRTTLANSLQAIVNLDVVPGREGARHLVVDLLPNTPAIARMIREDRLHQVDAAAVTQPGHVSRDDQLRRLCERGAVPRLAALECARDPGSLAGISTRVMGGE